MKLLFIHHSTGANLIHKGNLRKTLYSKTKEIEFWDHGYNLHKSLPTFILNIIANKLTFHTGLSDKDGKVTGTDYDINISNNNPHDFEIIFTADPNTNSTLKSILSYDVIAFKNCFPTTKIKSDDQLSSYKESYIKMRNVFDKYENKTFIPFTPPPMRKELTTKEYANRAKLFVQWLMSDEYIKNRKNIFVFDFFSLLADKNGYLKKEYCSTLPIDSHPNVNANIKIAPVFTNFLVSNLL